MHQRLDNLLRNARTPNDSESDRKKGITLSGIYGTRSNHSDAPPISLKQDLSSAATAQTSENQPSQQPTWADQLHSLLQTNIETINATTNAATQGGDSRSSISTNGFFNSVNKATGGLFGGLSGAFPMISGLLDLFKGGEDTPPTLTTYAAPEKQSFGLALSQGILGNLAYNSDGLPRSANSPVGSVSDLLSSQPVRSSSSVATAAPASNITVHVQAMDSRSFLDHSDEIATAVRAAMLNSHPLNDVIGDL